MEKEFWLNRWEEGRIGFHRDGTHPLMERCTSILTPGQTVLLPLCGKSLDMVAMLEQGFDVVGVEIATLAIEDFFSESQIKYHQLSRPPFEIYQGVDDQVTLYQGDFFSFNASIYSGGVDLIYDRAGLIALPPAMRRRYIAHICSLLNSYPDASYMLICLEIDDRVVADGPPFTVTHQELTDGFSCHSIEILSELKLPLSKGGPENALQRLYKIVR